MWASKGYHLAKVGVADERPKKLYRCENMYSDVCCKCFNNYFNATNALIRKA